MNLKEIEEMIKLMNENKLSEIEIEKNGLKVRLKKEDNQIKQIIQNLPGESQGPQAGLQAPPEAAGEQAAPLKKLIEVKAPMVGTFYRAPAPDAEPFIEIGQEVKPDDTLCIIEAMKLMNEIKCEAKGRVLEILVENGHPVEYGQTIILLEPAE
jgi:oxaloacetate decarboxylase alpha subunit